MENIVKANIFELSKLSNISRPSIYRYIDSFKKDGVIDILNDDTPTLNSFRLNINKLDDIIKYHLKKENVLRK
jgi:Fe2+ or Zn2+ uptake regulation protein